MRARQVAIIGWLVDQAERLLLVANLDHDVGQKIAILQDQRHPEVVVFLVFGGTEPFRDARFFQAVSPLRRAFRIEQDRRNFPDGCVDGSLAFEDHQRTAGHLAAIDFNAVTPTHERPVGGVETGQRQQSQPHHTRGGQPS